MKGYLNNEKATSEAFTADGWIRSGDIGYVKEGRWYVVDRTKDLIKVRGWQVSPAEIECTLLEHPNVTDAAVIGIKALDDSGETPQAFIVRDSQSEVNEKDIKDFLGRRLARYKGVSKVEFVDAIPRNPTGKILRRVLRDSVYKEIPTTPPDAALAYSNAIRKLEESREKHSVSSTSTISTTGPITPPGTEETPLGKKGRKRMKEDTLEEPQLTQSKRRSARSVVMKSYT
jgi:AMP-binding enzyme C-terminal domain/AMP-binding enzyme